LVFIQQFCIGANALVTADTKIPCNSLVLGVPGKVVKQDERFVEMIQSNAEVYKVLSKKHLDGLFPVYKK